MKQFILILLIATAFRLSLEIIMPTTGNRAATVAAPITVIKPAAVAIKKPTDIDILQDLKNRGIWDNQVVIHETGHLIAYVILSLQAGQKPVIKQVDLKGDSKTYGGAVSVDKSYIGAGDYIRIKLAGAAAWVAYQNHNQCSEWLMIDEYKYFTRTQSGTAQSDYSIIEELAAEANMGDKEILAEFKKLVTTFRTTHYNTLITTAAAIPKDAILSPAACEKLRDIIVKKINETK